jgi:hypothetical protein
MLDRSRSGSYIYFVEDDDGADETSAFVPNSQVNTNGVENSDCEGDRHQKTLAKSLEQDVASVFANLRIE